MTFKLGKSISKGQKIKTSNGWRVVIDVTYEGAVVKDGVVKFGDTVYAWKQS